MTGLNPDQVQALREQQEEILRSWGWVHGYMLAAVARKDYGDRRRRQKQGQERAKAEGKPFRGKRLVRRK